MKLTKKQRAKLREKYDGKCAYCGCELPDRWHADHLDPVIRTPYGKSKGKMERPSLDTFDNLMPSCPPCNNYKHSMSLESWRNVLADLPYNLERNNNTYRHALRFGMVQPIRQPITFYFENSVEPARSDSHQRIVSLCQTIKDWWEDHKYDTCGEYGDCNVYDDEPEFVTAAKDVIGDWESQAAE